MELSRLIKGEMQKKKLLPDVKGERGIQGRAVSFCMDVQFYIYREFFTGLGGPYPFLQFRFSS